MVIFVSSYFHIPLLDCIVEDTSFISIINENIQSSEFSEKNGYLIEPCSIIRQEGDFKIASSRSYTKTSGMTSTPGIVEKAFVLIGPFGLNQCYVYVNHVLLRGIGR